jgi:hypothetical protein
MAVSGQLHAPASFLRGNSPQYPVDIRLGGPQRRSERRGEEENLLLLPEIEPRPSSPQPVTIPTELSRLLTGGRENAKAGLGVVTKRNIRA